MGIGKKKSKLARVDPEFNETMMRLMGERYKRGLCNPKDITMREATSLLNRSLSIKFLEEEFKTRPKKKNGK